MADTTKVATLKIQAQGLEALTQLGNAINSLNQKSQTVVQLNGQLASTARQYIQAQTALTQATTTLRTAQTGAATAATELKTAQTETAHATTELRTAQTATAQATTELKSAQADAVSTTTRLKTEKHELAQQIQQTRLRMLEYREAQLQAKNAASETISPLDRLKAAAKNAGDGIAHMAKQAASAALDHLKQQAEAAVGAMERLAKAMAVAGAAATAASVKMAGDLEASVDEIKSIKPEIDTSKVFSQLNELSTKIPQSATTMADSLYNIFSSLDVTQQGAMQLVEEFSRGAVGAKTDANTFGTAVMGVMNAYKMEVSDASHISDVFFNTVKLGVVNGQQLASSLGPVTASAKAAGVSFDELGALIVGVTKEGGDAAQNINNLNNLLMKFTTNEAQQALSDLGVATKDAQGNFLPMTDVLAQLKGKLGDFTQAGQAAALQKIFPDAQARQGAQTLLGELDAVKGALDANINQAGAAKDAFETMSRGFNAQFTILKNTVQAAGRTIGAELLPALTEIVRGASEAVRGFIEFEKQTHLVGDTLRIMGQIGQSFIQPIVNTIREMVGGMGNGAVAVDGFLNALQSLKPVAAGLGQMVAGGIQTVASVVGWVAGVVRAHGQDIQNVINSIGNVFSTAGAIIGNIASWIGGIIDKNFSTISNTVSNAGDAVSAALSIIGTAFDAVKGPVGDFIGGMLEVNEVITGVIAGALEWFAEGMTHVGETVREAGYIIQYAWVTVENFIIDAINVILGAINFFIGGINKLIGAYNTLTGSHMALIGEMGLLGHATLGAAADMGSAVGAANTLTGAYYTLAAAANAAAAAQAAANVAVGQATGSGVGTLAKNVIAPAAKKAVTSGALGGGGYGAQSFGGGGGGGGGGEKEKDPLQEALDLSEKLSKAAEALSKINDYKNVSMAALKSFNDDMSALILMWVAAAGKFNQDALKAAGTYADTGSKVADTVGKMADALGKVRDWKALAETAIRSFIDDSIRMVLEFAQAGQQFSVEMLKAAILFAETAGKVGEAIGKMVEGLQKVAGYIPLAKSQIDLFIRDTRIMTEEFGNAGLQFPQVWLQAAERFSTTASKVGDGIAKMAEGLSKVSNTSFLGRSQIDLFIRNVREMAEEFAHAGNEFSAEMLANAPKFAEPVGKVGEAVGKMAEGLDKVKGYGGIAKAAIDAFMRDLKDLVRRFADEGRSVDQDMVTAATRLAETGGKVTEVLGKGVSAFEGVQDYKGVAAAAFDLFFNDLKTALQSFKDNTGSLKGQLDEATTKLAEDAGKMLSGLKSALDLFNGLNTLTPIAPGALNTFMANVRVAIDAFNNRLAGMDPEVLKTNAAASELFSKIFSGLKSAVETLKGIGEFKAISQKAVNDFLDAVQGTIGSLAGRLGSIAPAQVAAAQQFASQASQVFTQLKSAVDVISGLEKIKGDMAAMVGGFLEGVRQVLQKCSELDDTAGEILRKAESYADKMSRAAAKMAEGAAAMNGVPAAGGGGGGEKPEGHATGGFVDKPVRVGEQGEEYFIPSMYSSTGKGRVMTNAQVRQDQMAASQAGGGNVIYLNPTYIIQSSDPAGVRKEIEAYNRRLGQRSALLAGMGGIPN